MAKSTFVDAKVMVIEGWDYEAVLKRTDMCYMNGKGFWELDKGDIPLMKFFTGSTRKTRELNAVELELTTYRDRACENLVGESNVPAHASAHKHRVRKRIFEEQVASHAHETMELELPAFDMNGETVESVKTCMPVRLKGNVQLEATEAVLYWVWARVQTVEVKEARAKPKTAAFEPRDGCYFHAQKQGYVAKRPFSDDTTPQKYKIFKFDASASFEDRESVVGEAVSWSASN